jgi:hypothetical protein
VTAATKRRWWGRAAGARRDRGPVAPAAAAATESWVRPIGLAGSADTGPPTAVGTLDGPGLATVDALGLVTPAGAAWSLDWWVGADDRWHLPSQEVAVRQQLMQHAPVVETSMRVPGGDAVQRVFAVQVPDGHVLVVEVENQSSIPFALAWAVRPFTDDAVGRIDAVAVDGPVVSVDGAPAVVLDRFAGRSAAGTSAGGDLSSVVFGGKASVDRASAECTAGLAQAAAIVAVPHRATVRAVLPLSADQPIATTFPPVLPSAADVASGWAVHVDNGVRFQLPDGPVADAAERARRWLLLGATEGGHLRPALLDRGEPLLNVAVADALGELGHDVEASRLLAAWFVTEPVGVGAIAPALVALERHWRRTDDVELTRAAREQIRDGVALVADRIGRAEVGAAVACWAVAALHAGSVLLEVVGDRRASADAADAATRSIVRRDELLAAASLDAGGDTDLAAAVLRAAGLGALEPDHAAVDRVLAALAVDATGRTDLTIATATVEVLRGQPTGFDRITAWLGQRDVVDLASAARFLRLVRRLFVAEREVGIEVVPALPVAWLGQGFEAHAVPLDHGSRLSFAVRWHGPRPALLWEVQVGGATPALTSGIDPSWQTTESSGDALLAAPTTDPPPERSSLS